MPSPVIERRGCCRVQAYLCCSVLLALAAITLSRLPWPMQALAVLLVLASGGRELYCAWPGSRGYLWRFQVTQEGRLLCGPGRDGDVLAPVNVLHWWTLGGWMAGLSVRLEGGRRTRVILFRDQLTPDQWRRLIMCLRLGRSEPDSFT